ncbi:universal stress protein [Microbacterium sp. NIBRBAC000506063]|uniref:universal stress protein n=1 Tax=Microbacterium sp. NIBRBAC000506063 TaxID=2734618 RepID=UPI001CB6D3FD|nr:universal stress protein [Microbacterium sp. NIBRBAC000506063]
MVGEGAVLEAARADAETTLAEQAARVADSGVAVTTRLVVGDPVSELIEASQEAALLVIGSDYRGPGAGPARGSHGIRVVAGAGCPVAVVPDVERGEHRGVVVGVDGSEVSERAIAFAAAEADRLQEPLIAVSVWTPVVAPRNAMMVMPEDYRTGMNEQAQGALSLSLAGLRAQHPGLEIEEHIVEGYPSAVINQFAEDARLTVVGSRGRGAIRRFLLGSISHEVLQRLATVTVVVR